MVVKRSQVRPTQATRASATALGPGKTIQERRHYQAAQAAQQAQQTTSLPQRISSKIRDFFGYRSEDAGQFAANAEFNVPSQRHPLQDLSLADRKHPKLSDEDLLAFIDGIKDDSKLV